MLIEIYALLWKALRETVLLLWHPVMEKEALLRETVLTITIRTGKRNAPTPTPKKSKNAYPRTSPTPQIFSYFLYDKLHIPTENFHISVTELGVNPKFLQPT